MSLTDNVSNSVSSLASTCPLRTSAPFRMMASTDATSPPIAKRKSALRAADTVPKACCIGAALTRSAIVTATFRISSERGRDGTSGLLDTKYMKPPTPRPRITSAATTRDSPDNIDFIAGNFILSSNSKMPHHNIG